jgi:hypothetical protein
LPKDGKRLVESRGSAIVEGGWIHVSPPCKKPDRPCT